MGDHGGDWSVRISGEKAGNEGILCFLLNDLTENVVNVMFYFGIDGTGKLNLENNFHEMVLLFF